MSIQTIPNSPTAVGALTDALCTFLLANVTGLQSSIEGFPEANQQLVYPAITVFAKQPVFNPVFPYIIARGSAVNGVTPIQRCVGMYDFTLQLDLWTAYKSQRDVMVEALNTAFSQNMDSSGVNLTLSNYYNETTHLSIKGIEFVNDNSSGERSEWRALISVVCSVRTIVSQTAVLITTIENHLDTTDTTLTPTVSVGGISII